eukprot:gene8107-8945_t
MLALRNILATSKSTIRQSSARSLSSFETYRPKWPIADFKENEPLPVPPVRTISDDKLKFTMSATMERGTSIFYPHLDSHPGDIKVRLVVKVDDLGLSREEIQILIAFVGKRFNSGRRELKLVADKFPNRVENKRYVTLLLEQIIAEVRKLNAERSNYM